MGAAQRHQPVDALGTISLRGGEDRNQKGLMLHFGVRIKVCEEPVTQSSLTNRYTRANQPPAECASRVTGPSLASCAVFTAASTRSKYLQCPKYHLWLIVVGEK